MASDGQATEDAGGQPVKFTADKIFQIGKSALWGGSGNGGAIGKVKVHLDNLGPSKQGNHQELCRNFSEILLKVNHPRVHAHAQMGFSQGSRPTAFALMVQYEGNEGRIVDFMDSGADENYEQYGYQAIGSGSALARTSLHGYRTAELSLDQAKVLAYMTVQKAIDIAAYGLGPPVDIWTLCKGLGSPVIQRLTVLDKQLIADTAKLISQAQLEVFTAWKLVLQNPSS